MTFLTSLLPVLLSAQVTYVGGSQFDRVQGVAVDANDQIVGVGNTHSTSLQGFAANKVGFASTHKGVDPSDGYVAIFSPDLASISRWTFLGGTGDDRVYSVIPVSDGIWVEGWTESSDLPKTTGPGLSGTRDVYVAKLSTDLSQVLMLRYLGGASSDESRGAFTVDAAQNVYICGRTQSATGFPTTAAYQNSFGGGTADVFVAKLTPQGAIVWATYLGGSGDESCYSLKVSPVDGSVIGAGQSTSPDFPTTPGAYQTQFLGPQGNPNMGDGIVFRLSADGQTLLYATYLGGTDDDMVGENHSLAVDAQGRAHVIGRTQSTDFPVTAGALGGTFGGGTNDVFVSRLSADGSALEASTYLGGAGEDSPSGIVIAQGGVFVTGDTSSTNFPITSDALQSTFAGGQNDLYAALLDTSFTTVQFGTYLGGNGAGAAFGDRGRDLAYAANGDLVVSGDSNSTNFPVTTGVFDTSYNGGSADGIVARLHFSAPMPVPDGGTNDMDSPPDAGNGNGSENADGNGNGNADADGGTAPTSSSSGCNAAAAPSAVGAPAFLVALWLMTLGLRGRLRAWRGTCSSLQTTQALGRSWMHRPSGRSQAPSRIRR